MRCKKCGTAQAFGLELVREGRVHECWRCACSVAIVKSEPASDLAAEWVREPGRLLVRLACRNAFIFDKALFARFVRAVARDVKAAPSHLVLNLEGVALLPDAFLDDVLRLRRFLVAQGKSMKIVQRSPLFRALAVARETGVGADFAADEGAALHALPAEPVLAAASV